jgi:glycosyltransferase involved in cell wall biosynthesis
VEENLNKRVLFISQYFYPENFKGNDLVFELQQRGYDIDVITGKPNYPQGFFFEGYGFFKKNFEIINSVNIYRLPIISRGKGSQVRLLLNYVSFYFSCYFFFLFIGRKLKYDVIITQQLSPMTSSLPAIWFKKLNNARLITWTLDLWPESVIATTKIKKGIIIHWLDILAKKLYHSSDVILVSSKSFTASINSKISSCEKIVFFPNWADNIFEKNIKKRLFPKLPHGFNIVFAGNLGEAQDLSNVIKCIKFFENSHTINFLFVGSGRYELELRRETLNFNNVFIFPQHSVDYMPSLYEKSSVMLLSLKGGESISNTVPAKLQTYMSCGKPVVAMIDGEANDVIRESNCGLVANAGNFEKLAEYIEMLSKMNSFELDQLGKNGQEYYQKNYSRELAISKIEDLINSDNFN